MVFSISRRHSDATIAQHFAGYAGDDCAPWYVSRHDRPRSDYRFAANRGAGHDDRTGTDPYVISDDNRTHPHFALLVHRFRQVVEVVRVGHDHNIGAHYHVIAERYTTANHRILAELGTITDTKAESTSEVTAFLDNNIPSAGFCYVLQEEPPLSIAKAVSRHRLCRKMYRNRILDNQASLPDRRFHVFLTQA
jgi:hypothetical protein